MCAFKRPPNRLIPGDFVFFGGGGKLLNILPSLSRQLTHKMAVPYIYIYILRHLEALSRIVIPLTSVALASASHVLFLTS